MKRNFLAFTIANALTFGSQAEQLSAQQAKSIDPTLNIQVSAQGHILRKTADQQQAVLALVKDQNGLVQKVKQQDSLTGTRNYFVELASEPLTSFTGKARQKTSVSHQSSLTAKQQLAADIRQQHRKIKQQQLDFLQQVKSQSLNARLVRQFSQTINSVVVNADQHSIEKIKLLPNVKRVIAEQRYHTTLVDSVPLINAPKVWQMLDADDQAIDGSGVSVAILDTGIDYTHPDLGGCLGQDCKVVNGWDFVNNDADPMDGHGHGTHVAGIVAAEAEGYSGVAPKAKLHAYKVLSDDGWGSNTDIIAALEHAVDPDNDPLTDDAVDIINMSLGGGGSPTDPLSVATNAAVDAGIIVVVAAGNDGNYGAINASSPANAEKAITVASSTKSDELSYFSSKALLEDNVALKPEITAPGSDINSSYLEHDVTSLSGTSMASPHVAGAVALLKQAKPELTAQRAKELLMASAVDLGLDPLAQGSGRMDIEAAFAVDTVIPEGLLNLGTVDKALASWTSSASFTINNISDVEQSYQLSISDNLIAAAVATLDSSDITLAAGEQTSVNLTITVEDVANFPVSQHKAGIHFADVEVVSDNKTTRVPFAFKHATTLTLKNESNSYVSVLINASDGEIIDWPSIAPNETKEIMASHGEYNLLSQYNMNASDFPELLPADTYGQGIIKQSVVVEQDSEFILTTDSLTDVVGLNDYINKQGVQADKTELSSGGISVDIAYPGGSMSSFVMGNTADYYFVFGDISDDTSVSYSSQYQAPEDDSNDTNIFNYSYLLDHNNRVNALYDIDLQSTAFFTLGFDQQLTVDNDWSIFVGQPSMTSFFATEQPEQVFVFSDNNGSNVANYAIVGQYRNFAEWDYQLIASSEQLSFADSETLHQHDYWTREVTGTLSGTEHSLTPNNNFFSAILNFDGSEISFYDEQYSALKNLITNTKGFGFGDLNTQYQFSCDGEQQAPQALIISQYQDLRITKPQELTCSDWGFTVSYDSYLNQSKYRSSAYYPINQQLYASAPKSIRLYEGDKQVNDQVVDKINARLEISYQYLNSSGTELFIQLDGQQWQPLNSYIKQDNTLVADLAMLAGDHIANIKIESNDYNGGKVVHTLNGFFTIGLAAGSEHDVDDDGISNDVDNDNDNDGVDDEQDLFPYNSSEWADNDLDGIGDNTDPDDDNDGYLDEQDAMPFDETEQFDTDLDGIGNNADNDDDNDSVNDSEDVFPFDAAESVDTDGDGTGNNADTDDDNDGVLDSSDYYPLDASRSERPVATTAEQSKKSGGGGSTNFTMLAMLIFGLLLRAKVTQSSMVVART